MAFSFALIGTSSQGSAQQLGARLVPADLAAAVTAPSSEQRLTPAPADLTDTNLSVPAAVPQSAPAVTASVDAGFDSLAEAVAAHAGAEADAATRCLASAIYFESKGEPLAGQLAVAQVILNRARSGRFPPEVCDVVLQRGQFGFVRAGRIPAIDEARAAYRTAVAVARVALAKAWHGPAPSALYFNTPGNPPGARLTKVASIGGHVFYR